MKFVLLGVFFFLVSLYLSAQDSISHASQLEGRILRLEEAAGKVAALKMSGYMQVQGIYESVDDATYRLGIRRGRIKLDYRESLYRGLVQLDITEKGVGVKDIFFQVSAPFLNTLSFKAGIFDRPFGYEISYSSSRRESPERSVVFATLFPEERDMGASLSLQAPASHPLHLLQLDAGFFAGNGINLDTDNKKDFIAHLRSSKALSSGLHMGVGASVYHGGVYNAREKAYLMQGDRFVEQSVAVGSFSKRSYWGLDAQLSMATSIGRSQLRAEYIRGRQPGTRMSSCSPNYASLDAWGTEVDKGGGEGIFIRPFAGYYIYFIQSLGASPLNLVLKYDVYDPNTSVDAMLIEASTESAAGLLGAADLAVSTLGVGGVWKFSNILSLMCYYEYRSNEQKAQAQGNKFTLRMQCSF